MTSPAISSCTGPCSMMMRSFSKPLKMSKARSPIPEDSMTMGTKGMPRFAVFMRGVARRRAWRSMFFVFSRRPAYGVTELAVRVQAFLCGGSRVGRTALNAACVVRVA